MTTVGGADSRWEVVSSSERGSAHVSSGQPNQDAVAWRELSAGGLVVAVSDGHGSQRSPRSNRGSRFAVDVACEVTAQEIQKTQAGVEPEHLLRTTILPTVLDRWRAAVLADVVDEPLDDSATDAFLTYGATLLLAIITATGQAAAQIGDGDIVVGRDQGGSTHLIPPDEQFVGGDTSSLCLDDALEYARTATVQAGDPAQFLLLATDGYGNSFADENWVPAVGADLLDHLRSRGVLWMRQRLGGWLAESAEVAGDDVTVAMVVAPSALTSQETAPPKTTGVVAVPRDAVRGGRSKAVLALVFVVGLIAISLVIGGILKLGSGSGDDPDPATTNTSTTEATRASPPLIPAPTALPGPTDMPDKTNGAATTASTASRRPWAGESTWHAGHLR